MRWLRRQGYRAIRRRISLGMARRPSVEGTAVPITFDDITRLP